MLACLVAQVRDATISASPEDVPMCVCVCAYFKHSSLTGIVAIFCREERCLWNITELFETDLRAESGTTKRKKLKAGQRQPGCTGGSASFGFSQASLETGRRNNSGNWISDFFLLLASLFHFAAYVQILKWSSQIQWHWPFSGKGWKLETKTFLVGHYRALEGDVYRGEHQAGVTNLSTHHIVD